MVRSSASVRDVDAGDFGHKGVATRNRLVGRSMPVGFWVGIGGIQDELIGPVDANVV